MKYDAKKIYIILVGRPVRYTLVNIIKTVNTLKTPKTLNSHTKLSKKSWRKSLENRTVPPKTVKTLKTPNLNQSHNNKNYFLKPQITQNKPLALKLLKQSKLSKKEPKTNLHKYELSKLVKP